MPSKNLVIIAVSTGGPLTLKALFREIPPLNAAFLVVLHITPQMDYRIAQGLDAVASMPVRLAEDGEYLQAGRVYLAPGGFHLQLDGNQRVLLCEGPRVNYVQPAADVAMLSVTRPVKGALVGIVLTGMGRDGSNGIRHIKDLGGVTIAQDQHSSTIYGMPKAALETGAVDFVLPPKKIAEKLVELLG